MAISLPSVFSVIVHGRLKCRLLRIYTRSRLHAKHARRVCRSSITRLIFFMTIWTSQRNSLQKSQVVFDKSQIVCREKISAIPQSTSCLNQKYCKLRIVENIRQLSQLCLILYEICDFPKMKDASYHRWFSRSPRLFWQVSDCLSRKNIWDSAKHLSLVPIHWKSQKMSK